MTLQKWLTSITRTIAPQQRAGTSQLAQGDVRLHVANTTRQTVLADRLETADQGANRRKGLLGRKGLAPGEGLWIRPCEAVHTFFMQFPIDLVYLDRKLRIRKLRSNVGPWRLSGCLTAHSVLELPAGTIHATQTQLGDNLEFTAIPRQS